MEKRICDLEQKIVNYSWFFFNNGYIKLDSGDMLRIKKEETWLFFDEKEDEDDVVLEYVKYTTEDNQVFMYQSRNVKNFLEIDFIELNIKCC